MYLDCNKSLSFVSALALTLACGCSSKTNQGGDQGTGGSGYQTGSGGGSAGGGTSVGINQLCNGIFSGLICSSNAQAAVVKTPNMLLVIDESYSMSHPASTAAGASTASKWSDMKAALSGALTLVQDQISFGLELFPFDPSGPISSTASVQTSCTEPTGQAAINVDIAPGAANLAQIISTLNQHAPGGGTPTNAALQQAFWYFTQGPGKDVTGDKFVLLATDGGPNCNSALQCAYTDCTQNLDGTCQGNPTTTANCCDTAITGNPDAQYGCLDNLAVVDQIDKLHTAGIPTYVIGIPGSEAYATTLNSMAQAGGVTNPNPTNGESYYAVAALNSSQSLQQAFAAITTKLVRTCDIPLDSSPQDPSTVQVVMNCSTHVNPLPNNSPDGGADGFTIDYNPSTPGPAHVIIQGAPCRTITNLGLTSLNIIVGCAPPP